MGTKVTGRELLRAALARLPPEIKAKLQTEITASANELADLARTRVPVDSGALRDSIRVKDFDRGGIGALVIVGGPTTTKQVANGKSPVYDYAWATELGTQDMLAHPFLYPSYRQMKPKIKRNSAKAVKAAVEAVGPTA